MSEHYESQTKIVDKIWSPALWTTHLEPYQLLQLGVFLKPVCQALRDERKDHEFTSTSIMDLSNNTVRSKVVKKVAQTFKRVKWLIACSPIIMSFTVYNQLVINKENILQLHISIHLNCPNLNCLYCTDFILISFFPLHQASQWASQVNSVLSHVSCAVKYTVHACSRWGVRQCRIGKDSNWKLHSYQRPWWSCEASVQCPQNVGSSRCGD